MKYQFAVMASVDKDTQTPDESHGNPSTNASSDTASEKSMEITRECSHDVLTPTVSKVSRASFSSLARRVTSVGTTGTTDPNFEVDWEEDDPQNPNNWSLKYKGMVIGFLSWNTWVV